MNGLIFSIERFALDDGPGIRTLVFFKGCPLKCWWCANPEGQEHRVEIVLFPEKCIGCGECIKACPHNAVYFTGEGKPAFHAELCTSCGKCSSVCHSGARRLYGFSVSVDDLYSQIANDLPFYRRSGGGVTLSGGEPLMQWKFAREILRMCHQEGVHTAVETCGHYPWEHIESSLPYLDQVFFDLKHMDPQRHREITGKDNLLILDNARKLFRSDVSTVVRVPVIPGVNDDSGNILTMARFLSDYPHIKVELLPYHALGAHKYRRMNRVYKLEEVDPPKEEQLLRLSGLLRENNISCQIH